MRIKKVFKPSFHKANARYRGVTEHAQYTNFLLESVHDIFLLANIKTGNQKVDLKGHESEIHDNFVSIMTGDTEVGKSNLFTASTLNKINKDRDMPIPTLENWSPVNGCTRTQIGDVFRLKSDGLLDPVGLYTTLYVEPGDSIYIRLKVKSGSGAEDFSFGSNNMRQGPTTVGDTKKVSIEKDADFVVLDYVLRAKYAEAVSININVHEAPATLTPDEVEIKDLEIYYIDESEANVSSYHTIIKPKMNELEEKINSIR